MAHLPSGNLTVCYWKWLFIIFIVDFPINRMVIFQFVMLNYQRLYHHISHYIPSNPIKSTHYITNYQRVNKSPIDILWSLTFEAFAESHSIFSGFQVIQVISPFSAASFGGIIPHPYIYNIYDMYIYNMYIIYIIYMIYVYMYIYIIYHIIIWNKPLYTCIWLVVQWCNNHLFQNMSLSMGRIIIIPYMKWKIKHVWNHQPNQV